MNVRFKVELFLILNSSLEDELSIPAVPPLHTINHPHLRLVNDSPVLINNFFFARRPWFFFSRRDVFCAYFLYYVSIRTRFFL